MSIFELYLKRIKSLKSVMALLLFCLSFTVMAQNETEKSLVIADSTWSTEIIPFPIDWLPKLTLKGIEELRFSPNWNNPEHDQFWTLAMAWQVQTTTEISLEDLKFNLHHYFDMLMHPNHWAQDFPNPTLVLTDLETTENGIYFKGKLTFFDGFHTGKMMFVNILGSQTLCETTGRSTILFRLSPKTYGDEIWDVLNAIEINDRRCEN